jgi:hypothetical protein
MLATSLANVKLNFVTCERDRFPVIVIADTCANGKELNFALFFQPL